MILPLLISLMKRLSSLLIRASKKSTLYLSSNDDLQVLIYNLSSILFVIISGIVVNHTTVPGKNFSSNIYSILLLATIFIILTIIYTGILILVNLSHSRFATKLKNKAILYTILFIVVPVLHLDSLILLTSNYNYFYYILHPSDVSSVLSLFLLLLIGGILAVIIDCAIIYEA